MKRGISCRGDSLWHAYAITIQCERNLPISRGHWVAASRRLCSGQDRGTLMLLDRSPLQSPATPGRHAGRRRGGRLRQAGGSGGSAPVTLSDENAPQTFSGMSTPAAPPWRPQRAAHGPCMTSLLSGDLAHPRIGRRAGSVAYACGCPPDLVPRRPSPPGRRSPEPFAARSTPLPNMAAFKATGLLDMELPPLLMLPSAITPRQPQLQHRRSIVRERNGEIHLLPDPQVHWQRLQPARGRRPWLLPYRHPDPSGYRRPRIVQSQHPAPITERKMVAVTSARFRAATSSAPRLFNGRVSLLHPGRLATQIDNTRAAAAGSTPPYGPAATKATSHRPAAANHGGCRHHPIPSWPPPSTSPTSSAQIKSHGYPRRSCFRHDARVISPSGHHKQPDCAEDSRGPTAIPGQNPPPRPETFVVDGGYLENSGADTAVDLWSALAPLIDDHNQDPHAPAYIVPPSSRSTTATPSPPGPGPRHASRGSPPHS